MTPRSAFISAAVLLVLLWGSAAYLVFAQVAPYLAGWLHIPPH